MAQQSVRNLYTDEQKVAIILEFEKSDMLVKDFARSKGMSDATIYHWRKTFSSEIERARKNGGAALSVSNGNGNGHANIHGQTAINARHSVVPGSSLQEESGAKRAYRFLLSVEDRLKEHYITAERPDVVYLMALSALEGLKGSPL